MNYKNIHDSLIGLAKSRRKPDCYCERHHVIPRSMGGEDTVDNLVWLTAREHYVVHWLLYKIHKNNAMAFAWYRMTSSRSSGERYTSWSFKYAKEAKAMAMRSRFKGRKLSAEHREKLRQAKLGKTYEQMNRGPSTLTGRSLSEEHKEKVRASGVGRTHSPEVKQKLRLARLGDKNPNFGKVTPESVRAKLSEATTRYRAKLKALKETV